MNWYEGIVRMGGEEGARGMYVEARSSREAWILLRAEVEWLRAGRLIAVRPVREVLAGLSDSYRVGRPEVPPGA